MATLQAYAHFWTTRDDVIISDCDLGIFKYQLNKESDLLVGPYGNLKRSFCESRDKPLIPSNKRPYKLKETLIEFEELLAQNTLVHVEWSVEIYGSSLVIFNNGIIVHVVAELQSSNLKEILIDRSLEGKLPADIVNVFACGDLLVMAHGIPSLTVVRTNHSSFFTHYPSSLNQSTVSVNTIQLPGPGTRRHEKKVIIEPNHKLVCVWWEREGGELFAWAPVVRAEDRANILIYSSDCELKACYHSEHNPLSVDFSAKESFTLRISELLTSSKGRLTVRFTTFDLEQSFTPKLRRTLKIPSLPKCFAHSPDEQFMLLGCVDASLVLWDITKDSCTVYKASFIPFHLTWHGTSSFFTMSSDRGQMQCYDRALNPLLIRFQKRGDGNSTVHLQQYLRNQPSVFTIKWPLPSVLQKVSQKSTSDRSLNSNSKLRSKRKKSRMPNQSKSVEASSEQLARTPTHHLLVCFERGPFLCLQMLSSCWAISHSLDSYTICTEYLLWQQLEAAVQHVLSLNWNHVVSTEDEDNILKCFIRLVNSLLVHSSPAADSLLERVVTRVLDALKGQDFFIEPIYDAARRCCRAMLRRQRVQLAASYALRLQDMDLLTELILHARKTGNDGLANQAITVLDCLRDEFSSSSSTSNRSSRSSSYSSASETSCSTCENSHHSPSPPAQQLSNLNIDDNVSEDHVHVISFGVV